MYLKYTCNVSKGRAHVNRREEVRRGRDHFKRGEGWKMEVSGKEVGKERKGCVGLYMCNSSSDSNLTGV
jgi:hypothetical protein